MTTTQVSKSQCTELQSNPGYYLLKDAAYAWDRSVADFGKQVLITGAWRSYETQVEIFDSELHPTTGRYVRGNRAGQPGYTTDVRGRTADGGLYRGSWWTRKAGTAAAAVPGTSNHGGGLAVDVKTRREADDPPYAEAVIFGAWTDEDRTRFLRVANEHGWYDDEGRSVNELWHLTWYPARDKHRGQKPAPIEEEFLMALSDDQQELMFERITELVEDGDDRDSIGEALRKHGVLLRRDADRNRDQITMLREQAVSITALSAAVTTLASSIGVDPVAALEAVKDAVRDALPDTITIPLEG